MVTPGIVNGKASNFPPQRLCEYFCVFGRIPRFENPAKYAEDRKLAVTAAQPSPFPAPIQSVTHAPVA
jgi:hypothetical protein